MLCLVFLTALLLRVAVVRYLGFPPVKDALQYHTIAINQLNGYGHALEPGKPTSLRPPLYPLFLAGIYTITGADYLHALYAQALMHALLVCPLFWLGFRISGRFWIGILTACIFAIHTSFELVSQLLRENLTVALVVLFLCSAYAAFCRPDFKKFILVGIFAGLLGLTNPVFVPLGVAFSTSAIFRRKARTLYKMLILQALVSILIIAPWMVRNKLINENKQEQHLKLAIVYGYYPAFTGEWRWPVWNMTNLEEEREQAKSFIAQNHDNKALLAELRSKIMANPLGTTKLAFNRALLLWASPPVGISLLRSCSITIATMALFLNWLFVILGLIGLSWYCWKHEVLLAFGFMALYLTAVYAITHSIRRYGYPLVPQSCLFFVLSVFAFVNKFKGSR